MCVVACRPLVEIGLEIELASHGLAYLLHPLRALHRVVDGELERAQQLPMAFVERLHFRRRLERELEGTLG